MTILKENRQGEEKSKTMNLKIKIVKNCIESLFLIVCLIVLADLIVNPRVSDPPLVKPTKAELAKLDPFRERYHVDRVLDRIHTVPFESEKGFSFAVWADIQSHPEVFDRLWREIQKENVLFVITVGDLVDRGEVSLWLSDFFAIIDLHRDIPLLPVIGNHDVGYKKVEFTRIFGRREYAFDYGNARFVVVDSVDGLGWMQLRWIKRELAKAGEKHPFVFAHKPPTVIKKWAYHSFSKGADAFCDLLSTYRVDNAFFGHIHAYSTAKHDGVEYVVSGGGGGVLHNRYGPMGNVHHYCVVTVKGDEVSHQVVRLIDGQMQRSSAGNEFYQDPSTLPLPEQEYDAKKADMETGVKEN
ncbi:MAG: hypothetical protein C4527_26850 [Candidatus Omnitrophota bacterium]|jgi:predicted phosphodiesterase|nr:MAG: hypothetical protein C4527_26850 [Candidatus Omnitrophota bacterium]